MKLEKQCEHEFLKFVGMQPLPAGYDIMLGNCCACNSTRKISDDYVEIDEDIYERRSK